MPSKVCPKCRYAFPVGQYEAHRLMHVRQERERKGSTSAWRNLRELILARDAQKCVICGEPAVEVHHIDGDWQNDKPKNLRSVCFEHNPRGDQRAKAF
jgi:hypothetical protein